jgi:large subunit ribosomal protein L23
MAIFGGKKKTEMKKDAPSAAIEREMGNIVREERETFPSRVIIRPRITEKATAKSESGVYTFDVEKSATKNSIASAIKNLFKVTPVKIAIVPIKSKNIFSRGKRGRTKTGKKAYVYLKKGDVIEFV